MLTLAKNRLFNYYLPLLLTAIVLITSAGIYFAARSQPQTAEAGWYGASWGYRKPITINHSKVSTASSTTLSNFPVLISQTDSDLIYAGFGGKVASSTGGDILFTDADGVTKLPFEIESYASTTGQLIAWVQVPTLSPTVNHTIYIYFGNANATNQANPTGVWNDGGSNYYKGVWHLDESSSPYHDSTSNANNSNGGTYPTQTTGQIGNAQSFNGSSSQFIQVPDPVQSGNLITVSAWAKPTTSPASIPVFENRYNGNRGIVLYVDNTNYYAHSYIYSGAGGGLDVAGSTNLNDGHWHHLVATYDGTTLRVYVDGVLKNSGNYGLNFSSYPSSTATFGKSIDPGYGTTGIDEMEVSNTYRSADWISTEYNNQSSPSTFYTYGTLVTQVSANNPHIGVTSRGWFSTPTAGTWQYRMPLTINHTQVASSSAVSLTNFPVLVSLTSNNLKYTGSGGNVASSTGGDILFTAADGQTLLNYEIESYSSTTGQTLAWVKIPVLSATADNIIYMYYGNASATAETSANINGTWDSNYKGVYHLPNGSTLTANDSTSNGINGTLVNTPTATTGQIDGGANFASSSSQYITMGNNLNFGTGDFTLSAWIRPTNINQDVPVLVKRNNSAPYQQYNTLIGTIDSGGMGHANKKLSLFVFNGGSPGNPSDTQNYNTVNDIVDGNWHFVQWERTGTSVYIYVDGVSQALTATEAGTSAINGDNTSSFNVAYDNGSGYYNGQIDEVEISSAARSADWIKTEYNNQSAPSTFITAGNQQSRDAATPSSNWYNTSWLYRKAITIDHTKVSTASGTTLSNFPMLFSTSDNDLRYTGSGGKVASSTGGDLLFTDSDGVTKLPFELESYSSTTGQTIAWVQVPVLSPTSDHTIYIYFGNASVVTSQQNPTGVWDSNYKGVWHLANPTSPLDSTNQSNGTNNGSAATTGTIDGAGAFTASSNQYISLGNPSSLSGLQNSPITMSAWINPSTVSSGTMGWLYDRNSGATASLMGGEINRTAGKISVNVHEVIVITGNKTLSANTWNYVEVVRSGSSGAWNYSIYVNGVLDNSVIGDTNNSDASTAWSIGRPGGYNGQYFDGKLDEVRISNIARSADWIKTEYNNQNSPSTFYAYSALGANTRQTSASLPAALIKIRGGVKFH